MTRRLTRLVLVGVVACTIGCDQASKHFASAHLAGVARQSLAHDTLRLEYAENTGAFLSLGIDLSAPARTAVFTVGTAFILLLCLFVGLRATTTGPVRLGLTLVFAGGVSNLIDRVLHGSVVDFLNVGVGALRTGIFNVADMAIMAGVGVLLVAGRGRWD